MEQATIFFLLLCGVVLSAHAFPIIPEYKMLRELPENPWPEAEEEGGIINEEKRY